MYNIIYDFAIKRKLTSTEGFIPKYIYVYVLLDENSNYLGFEIKDKNNKEKTICPDIGSAAQNQTDCNPIAEKVINVFDKSQKKHTGFLQIMNLAAKDSKNVKIVCKFLNEFENNSKLEEKVLYDMQNLKLKLNSKEIVSFKIENLKLEEDDSWKMWFSNYMNQNKKNKIKKQKNTTISAITGKEIIPLTTDSPKLQSPSEILGTGAYINPLSKNSSGTAFKSYGLKNKDNFAISENEALTIKTGLEYLLSSPSHFNKDFGLIHFCEDENNEKILNRTLEDNLFSSLSQDKEEMENIHIKKDKDLILENTFESAKTGDVINTEIQNDTFHMMQFTLPTKGRFYLSNYKKGSCKELQKNILQWRQDSSIEWSYKTEEQLWIFKKDSIKNIYSIFFSSLEQKDASNKFEQVKKEFGDARIQLLYSIIENRQIPIKIFQKALFALRKIFIKNNKIDKICLQTIKAYLIREQRKKGEVTIMDKLNPTEESIGYNCGRLFAVYEQIQLKAQKNINASIIDNFFISAQQTPAFVFPRLATLSNHHLRKLDVPIRIYWNKKLQEVTENLSTFPKKLSMEEQGMFVLGYYHQKADLFKSNKNKEEGEENNEE